MVTGGPGQKPDWKKWPSLSDSDMVTGGLKNAYLDLVIGRTAAYRWYSEF